MTNVIWPDCWRQTGQKGMVFAAVEHPPISYSPPVTQDDGWRERHKAAFQRDLLFFDFSGKRLLVRNVPPEELPPEWRGLGIAFVKVRRGRNCLNYHYRDICDWQVGVDYRFVNWKAWRARHDYD